MLINKEAYLGDSVYIKKEGRQQVIYLNNGEGGHNIIYLEPEVILALLNYLGAEYVQVNKS
jgi:hypothetical protein